MQFDLVFEGGGAKGLVFLGALDALEASGFQAGRLLGTSAGAITAVLLAAGYDAATIQASLTEPNKYGKMRFSSFLDMPSGFSQQVLEASRFGRILQTINLPLVPNSAERKFDTWLLRALLKLPLMTQLFSFVERGGLFAGDDLLEWLREMLDANGRNFAYATLSQFYEVTGRELSVVAADTTDARLLILNHRTAPDCPLVWAVRMSVSVPFLWQEVIWQENWGTYSGIDLTGNAIVDGGLLSNFPMELFVSRDSFVTSIMGEPQAQQVLGCLIDETLPVNDSGIRVPPPRQTSKTLERILRLINTSMQAHDKMVLDQYSQQVVRLPAQGYGTTEFWMSEARMQALVDAGRSTMQQYLLNLPIVATRATRPQSVGQPTPIDEMARKMLSQ